jgi:ATP synthase I chain
MTPIPRAREPERAEAPAPSGPLDARMRRAILTVGMTGAVGGLGALVVAGPTVAFSVAVGGALATLNLWALARIIAALLPVDDRAARAQSRVGWALVGMIKMVALVAVVWLLMRHGVVAVLPMALGLGALPIGIAIGSLVSDRNAPPEDRP